MRVSTKKKTIISICLAVTLVLSTIAFAAVSYAWFAKFWNHGIDFQSGSNANLPEIDMWLYTSLFDDSNSANQGWVKVNEGSTTAENDDVDYRDPATDDGYKIPSVEVGGTANNYVFNNPELHFGRVDNLISLQPDNIVYLRLTVKSAETGSRYLRVNLDYNDPTPKTAMTLDDMYSSVNLYGINPTGNTQDTIKIEGDDLEKLIHFPSFTQNGTQLADLSTEYTQFMQIAVAVTTDETLVPGTEDFEEFEEYDPDDENDVQQFTDFDVIGGGAIVINNLQNRVQVSDGKGGTKVADTYYVYLKIAPRLEFFVLQENLLDQFVPSYMFFDTKIEIELH